MPDYLDRQEADILAFRKDEDMRLRADLDSRLDRRAFRTRRSRSSTPCAPPRWARRPGSRG